MFLLILVTGRSVTKLFRVDGLEQHDNSARQQILMTACQSKVIVPADAKTPTIA
jgi:hypothetical protein